MAFDSQNSTQVIEPATTSAKHDLSYLEGPRPAVGTPAISSTGRYFEGLVSNALVLGISKSQLLDSDAHSPFHSIASATSDYTYLPPSLRPTPTQHQYAHHPFFDCIPIPGFRDRTILAGATTPPLINRFAICWDLFAGGLSFSGDPAEEYSWAFSDVFRENWSTLLSFDIDELKERADAGAA
jgi:hypothetical protein